MMFKSTLLVLTFVASANAQQGSCSNQCGNLGPVQDANGQCYCDIQCQANQDCCGDYVQQCQGNQGFEQAPQGGSVCSGSCGSSDVFKSAGGQDCYCEASCQNLNDCCPGFVEACPNEAFGTINTDPNTGGNAGNTDYMLAIDELVYIWQRAPGPDMMGTSCQNRCGQGGGAMTDSFTGAQCYCDDACINQGDCCAGFLYHCDHPARVSELQQAAAATPANQVDDMCGRLLNAQAGSCDTIGCNCQNQGGCQDTRQECQGWANSGMCDNGHTDGTPAGWFQWTCPAACNAC